MNSFAKALRMPALVVAFVALIAFAVFSLGNAPGLFWVLVRWMYRDELGSLFDKVSFTRQVKRSILAGLVLTAFVTAFSNVPFVPARIVAVFGSVASFLTSCAIGFRVSTPVPLQLAAVATNALIFMGATFVFLLVSAPITKHSKTATSFDR